MLGQTRAVLEEYKKQKGTYTEVAIDGTGHTPFIEKPDVFNSHFHKFLNENK